MIDTVGIVILLLALLLAPASEEAATLDLIKAQDGRVVTLKAERGDAGFSLRAPEEPDEVLQVTHDEAGAFEVHLPRASEPLAFDLAAAREAIQGWKGEQPLTVKVEEQTYVLTRRGKLTYVVATGRDSVLVLR